MSSRDVRLPPERFFWGVLDVPPQMRSRRVAREQLGYLFEAVLPMSIENVHAAYVPLEQHGSRFLACGMAVSELEAVRDDAVTLGPSVLPEFLALDTNPKHINLLTGQFEPHEIRRLRRRWSTLCAGFALVGVLLLGIGHQRYVRALHQQASALHEMRQHVLAQALGEHAMVRSQSANRQPLELMLLAELRQLRQTRPPTPGNRLEQPTDSTDVLVGLLSQWPVRGTDPPHAQVESMSITPSSITVQTSLPSAEDVPTIAEALRPRERDASGDGADHAQRMLDGWLMQQPQVIAQQSGVRATLRLTSRGENRR